MKLLQIAASQTGRSDRYYGLLLADRFCILPVQYTIFDDKLWPQLKPPPVLRLFPQPLWSNGIPLKRGD